MALVRAFNSLPAMVRGMMMMLVTTLCFAGMQSMIKWLAAVGEEPMHPFEIAFFRNLMGVVAMLPMVMRGGTLILSRSVRRAPACICCAPACRPLVCCASSQPSR